MVTTRVASCLATAALLLAASSFLTACGASSRSAYSVSAVKAAFSAEGVDLHRFGFGRETLRDGTWLTFIGASPHLIHVNVREGPLVGIYKRVTNQLAAVGSSRRQYRNVLVAWRPSDDAIVTAALRRLK